MGEDKPAGGSGRDGKPKRGRRKGRDAAADIVFAPRMGDCLRMDEDNQRPSEEKPGRCGTGLTEFRFEGRSIRTVVLGGRRMFVANDVCAALGMANPRQAISALDGGQRGVHVMDRSSGSRRVNVITESGMYALAFKSEKPEARRFGRWVTEEVLPAIRETGRYEKAGAMPEPESAKALPWDLPARGRFIVTRSPDHIHETEVEDVAAAVVAINVQLLAYSIKTVEAYWHRDRHFSSIGTDGPARPVCPQLERAILDAGKLAQNCLDMSAKIVTAVQR